MIITHLWLVKRSAVANLSKPLTAVTSEQILHYFPQSISSQEKVHGRINQPVCKFISWECYITWLTNVLYTTKWRKNNYIWKQRCFHVCFYDTNIVSVFLNTAIRIIWLYCAAVLLWKAFSYPSQCQNLTISLKQTQTLPVPHVFTPSLPFINDILTCLLTLCLLLTFLRSLLFTNQSPANDRPQETCLEN